MAKALLIEGLLQGPKEVVIPIGEKKIALWVRPSRAPERTMATANARKASRTLRRLLNDRKTEEFDRLIQEELEDASKDELRKVWVNGKLIARAMEIRENSLEEREFVENPLDVGEGKGVTPKDMDEYEDKVEEAEENRELNVMQAITSAQRELDEEAKKIADKDLYEAAIPQLIESQCQQAYEVEFVQQLILRCTFLDKKCERKAFSDVEQVYSLKPSALEALHAAHLDVMVDQEAVKN
jgi:hypothetical protein